MSGRYFAGVTAVGVAAMGVAIKGIASIQPNLLDAPQCLEQPVARRYPIAEGLNNLLCKLNTCFSSAAASHAGQPFLQYFGGLFVAAVLVTVYEGFRPSSRRSASKDAHGNVEGFGMRLGVAQLSTIALLVGQVITAGIALPAYYACVSWSTPLNWRRHKHKVDLGDEVFFLPESARRKVRATFKHSVQYNANVPRSSFLYTTLIATVVGFILPSLWMEHAPAELKYDAQSLWQPFPLYMLAINVILPPLFRKGFTAVPPKMGIFLIAALGILPSLKSQLALFAQLQDGLSLADVFTFSPQPKTLAAACHRLLVTDFFLITLAVGSKVLLALARRQRAGTPRRWLYGALLVAGALVVGPGASIMLMWTYSELVALRHAREYAEVKEAKAVKGDEIEEAVVEVEAE